ncbi:MAG TPA: hypothetical protein VGI79_18280 [Caulobacteraceae bacterium]|jgi:hypothetical protein
MKSLLLSVAAVAALAASAARAEPYVDYTPQKGVWHVVTVKVEPSKVDDYVSELKKGWILEEEVAKKHGLIDQYEVKIKFNGSDGGGNVLLIEHIPNIGLLEVDQARDQAVEKDMLAVTPKADTQAKVKEFDKYRTFVGDDYWTDITYTK